MKISINDEYEVLHSGTVISHDNKAVCFSIDKLKFRMLFKEDPDDKDNNSIELKLDKDKTCLDILLTNYDNILGQGVVRPIEVGFYNNKRLSVQFIVTSMNKTGTRVIHYTWLLKELDHES